MDRPQLSPTTTGELLPEPDADQELREREQRYMHALDATLDGLWDWDIPTGRVYLSPQWIRLLGYLPEDVPQRVEFFYTILHPDDVARVQVKIDDHLAGRTPVKQDEIRLKMKSGEYRWFFDRGRVVSRDASGQPLRMVGTISDITERKQAEAALRDSETRMRLLIQAASVGLWDWDIATNEVYYSPEWKQQLGYEDHELPNRFDEWESRLHPDDREPTLAAVMAYREGKRSEYDIEFRLLHKDGSWRWIFTRAEIIRDAAGNPVRMMGCHLDVTARKESESALRTSDMALRTISQGVMVVGPDRRIQWVNEAVLAITGYSENELLGQACNFFKGASTDPLTLTAIDDALSQHAPFAGELLSYRKDGSSFWDDLTISPVLQERGEVLHHICVTRDITARKLAHEERARLEAQLQQAQKMESVGRLAGGVAHDFNNMLGVIIGHSSLALQRVASADPTHFDLEQIQTAAKRSADLTRQLLAFARKQTVSPRVLNLNSTVAGMLKMLPLLMGEDIEVTWLPGGELWAIRIDPSQVEQILTNLCVNARDAILGVGSVAIETQNCSIDAAHCAEHADALPGDYVKLTVSDSGAGMDATTIEQIFEPFFTTKGVGEGTGLGLSMVYGAVRQNQGFISVSSDPGRGSTFSIHLPRYQETLEIVALPGSDSVGTVVQGGNETILLVEDEAALLKLTALILTNAGYTVLCASTPADAVRRARQHVGGIHLLLTDVIMPQMNGRDLANLLGEILPRFERLFISGHTANVIARHGVLDRGVHFLQKPFSPPALIARVREALSSARA